MTRLLSLCPPSGVGDRCRSKSEQSSLERHHLPRLGTEMRRCTSNGLTTVAARAIQRKSGRRSRTVRARRSSGLHSTTLFLAVPSRSWFARARCTSRRSPRFGSAHLRLSVPRLFAQELDGNAQELFPGAALVNARQLLCVRPAEQLRRLETGQASHVLHCDKLEAGLPVPGHASRRVGDGPSLPLTAAVIDTADGRPARGLIHE
jgi:hypothetical protein